MRRGAVARRGRRSEESWVVIHGESRGRGAMDGKSGGRLKTRIWEPERGGIRGGIDELDQ
jgi:hypothetical protein